MFGLINYGDFGFSTSMGKEFMIIFPLLTSILLCPLIGALYILFVVKDEKLAKIIALLSSLAALVIAGFIYASFDPSINGFQLVEQYPLIESINCHFHLGIDGISILFILFTALLVPLCILASWNEIKFRVKEYMIAFLLLEMLIIGVFSALDFLLFYIFFEAMLIPMFLIIGIWGGERRIYAAIKFFLFTLAGSLFLLVAIIYIYHNNATFDIIELSKQLPKYSLEVQKWLWLALFISFAVKVPMFPVHTWLPDAHVEAPTAGSMILAGILLKMGAYGFLRFSLPMFPEASIYFSKLVFILSGIAIIYASFVAFAQTNMKKLVAYSSIAHMGFVTMGIFSFNQIAMQGALVQMISHGFISAGLFFAVGILYDRVHSKEIANFSGMANIMPKLALIFMILTMASVGLPSTSGFVGEMLVIVGMYKTNKFFAMLAATSLVFGAAYMLYLYRRVFFGENNSLEVSDMTCMERKIFIPLIILIFLFGVYPTMITEIFDLPIRNILLIFAK